MIQSDANPSTFTASAPRRDRWRRVAIVLLAVMIALLILRETGTVQLDAYKADWESHFESSMHRESPATSTSASTAFARRVTTSVNDGVARRVAEVLRKRVGGAKASPLHDLSLDVQQLALSGAYAVPLYKSGRCTFTASYQLYAAPAGKSVSMEGTVNGTIEFTVVGPCSIYKLRQLIADEVAKAIQKRLEKDEGKL